MGGGGGQHTLWKIRGKTCSIVVVVVVDAGSSAWVMIKVK